MLFWDVVCAGTKGLDLLADSVLASSGSIGQEIHLLTSP